MTGNVNNVLYRKSGTIGGGRSVIDQEHLQGRLTNGAEIVNPPAVGGVMFQGDVCEYSYSTKLAKHMRIFELADAVDDADTVIYFKRNDFTHVPEAGMVIMAVPSTLTSTGLYITLGTVTKTSVVGIGNVYSAAITAASFGSGVSFAAGALFTVGVSVGSIESYSVTTAGTGYVAGDLITVVYSGGANGVIRVTAVSEAGAITASEIVTKGTGYVASSATERTTTTNSTAGAGAKVKVLIIGAEMYVKAPNSILAHDVAIEVTPATSGSDYDGARYFAALFNVATLLGSKITPMPTIVKTALRTGYSDIKVFA